MDALVSKMEAGSMEEMWFSLARYAQLCKPDRWGPNYTDTEAKLKKGLQELMMKEEEEYEEEEKEEE